MKTDRIISYSDTSERCTEHIAGASMTVTRIALSVSLADIGAKNYLLLPFYAEMLERGSKGYKRDAYEEALESLGAIVSISSDGMHLSISIETQNNVMTRVLGVVKETLLTPLFAAGEITKLKKEFAQSLHELQDDSRHRAAALFSRMLYEADTPGYIPTLTAREKMLKNIDGKELKSLHDSMRRRKWYISVVGDESGYRGMLALARDIQHSHIETAIEIIDNRDARPGTDAHETIAGKQNVELYIGNNLPLLAGTPEMTAFSFGIDVLGKRGGFSGRLMSTVREKEGLTYSIYSWLSSATATRAGYWTIWTFFTPKDLVQGLTSTKREIQKISQKGVTHEEVTRFKRLLSNQHTLRFESDSTVLALYHGAMLAGLPRQYVDRYNERLEQHTAKSVSEILKRYLDPENLIIAGVGSIDGIPEV